VPGGPLPAASSNSRGRRSEPGRAERPAFSLRATRARGRSGFTGAFHRDEGPGRPVQPDRDQHWHKQRPQRLESILLSPGPGVPTDLDDSDLDRGTIPAPIELRWLAFRRRG